MMIILYCSQMQPQVVGGGMKETHLVSIHGMYRTLYKLFKI